MKGLLNRMCFPFVHYPSHMTSFRCLREPQDCSIGLIRSHNSGAPCTETFIHGNQDCIHLNKGLHQYLEASSAYLQFHHSNFPLVALLSSLSGKFGVESGVAAQMPREDYCQQLHVQPQPGLTQRRFWNSCKTSSVYSDMCDYTRYFRLGESHAVSVYERRQ